MAKKRKKPSEGVISNRRARFDYQLEESIVAGIVLNGRETKALRMGNGQLRGAYVTVSNDELWLINAQINGLRGIPIEEDEVSQNRKLLVSRKQLEALKAAKQQGRTIVPTEILTRGRFIKVRIAIGKGKKHYDKRQSIKKRDDTRNAMRSVKL